MSFFRRLLNYNVIRLILTAVSVFAFIKFGVPILGPFLFALVFVLVFRPILNKLKNKLHVPRGISAGLILLLLMAIIAFLLWLIADKCVELISFCTNNMDFIHKCCRHTVTSCCDGISGVLGMNAAAVKETVLGELADVFSKTRNGIPVDLIGVSTSSAEVIGIVLAYITFTVIAILLLAKDFQDIIDKWQKNRLYIKAVQIAGSIVKVLKIYVRAQLLIETCVVLLSVSGLLLLRVEGAIWLGVAAGAFDILPFIGTGIVYVPIIIWLFLCKRYVSMIGCIVLYAVCVLLRQLLEPKLLGEKMNIYPIFLLLSVFLGVRIFGAAGIFLGPISLFLTKEIYEGIRIKNSFHAKET